MWKSSVETIPNENLECLDADRHESASSAFESGHPDLKKKPSATEGFFYGDMHYVYILHSEKFDKYYVGQTSDVTARLYRHNSGYEGFISFEV